MIDTIVIKIKIFKVTSLKYFTKIKRDVVINSNQKEYMPVGKRICSLQKIKFKKNLYYPIISIQKRMGQKYPELIIQLSIGKLLYGTNLLDIDESCLLALAEKIRLALNEAEIIVTDDDIINSTIMTFHPSKIINFTGICSVHNILKTLENFNYKPCYDFSHTSYGFGKNGEFIKLYSGPLSITLYDKIQEIINTGYTEKEKELIQFFKKSNLELLKVEVAIQKKQAITRLAEKYFKVKKTDWTLKEIFNTKFCRFILNEQTKSVIDSKLARVVKLTLLDKKMIDLLIKKNFKTFSTQLEAYGMIYQIRQNGLNKFMKDLKQQSTATGFGRKKDKLNNILNKINLVSNEKIEATSEILRQLDDFKLYCPIVTLN